MVDRSVIGAITNFFKENGYQDATIIFDKVIVFFIDRIGHKVFLHFDENFLVLEQPHEMGRQGKRARDAFKLWVDLNDPDSLQTMLRYVSTITSWGDSPKN